MKRTLGVALVIVAVSASASAQSEKQSDKSSMADTMSMTYTGCIESFNHGATYLLTHVATEPQAMDHDAMHEDSMKTMKDSHASADDMHGDPMMRKSLVLGGFYDLHKHVGHKVSVKGAVSMASAANALDTLKINSIRMIGKSCK